MKKLLPLLFSILIIGCLTSYAQKKDDSDFHISIDDEDVDIDIVIDDLSDAIEKAFESLDGDLSIHIDDDDIDIKINDINIDWDDFEDNIEDAIEIAVKNMTIELKDIDADEFKHGHADINNVELRDLIEEIEDEYHQDVERIDRLQLKFEDKYTIATFDVTLENGKEVRNIRKKIRND